MFIYLSVNLILCPPNSAARNQRKIIKSVRDGTFEYTSREPVKTDWAQYDQAQIYEMIYYLDNIRDLVDEADERIKKRTPPENRDPADRQLIQLTSPKPYCYKRT